MKVDNLSKKTPTDLTEIDSFIKEEIETDTNDVETSDTVLESDDGSNTIVLTQNVSYRPTHTYWVGYNNISKQIVTLFGFPFPYIEDLTVNDPNIKMASIGRISEDLYKKLKASCGTFSTCAFFNPDDKSFYYRRIFMVFDDNVKKMKPSKHMQADDNIIRCKIFCFDDDDIEVKDENIRIFIKNMRTRDAIKKFSDVEINNHPNTTREIEIKSGEIIELKLNSSGVHNFRVSMYIPELSNQPMNHYFTAYKKEGED